MNDDTMGDIWIGDVVRAWGALAPADATERLWMAESLGFSYVERRPDPQVPEVIVQRPRDVGLPPIPPTVPPSTPPGDGEPWRGAAAGIDVEAISLPMTMTSTPRSTSAAPPAWASVSAPLDPEEPQHVKFRPQPVSLLTPGWTRAIVGAAAATRVADGPIDVERVIKDVCGVRPIAVLPRRWIWTMRGGVQILIDRGESMTPFAREAASLADSISAVAGRDRTAVLKFRACPTPWPSRGLDAARRQVTPYEPPAAGTTVVVITDLGLTRGTEMRDGASEADWLAFAAIVRDAGCALTAFVPSGPSRWTPALRRTFQIVAWDRSTSVSAARRIAKGEKG